MRERHIARDACDLLRRLEQSRHSAHATARTGMPAQASIALMAPTVVEPS